MTITTKKTAGNSVFIFHEASMKIVEGTVDRVYTETYCPNADKPAEVLTTIRYYINVPSLGAISKMESEVFDTAASVITTIKTNSGIV